MIKLKMTRDELHFLCNATSPCMVEQAILKQIKRQQFNGLYFYFIMLEVGVITYKKYLFDSKKSYKIGFKPSQAAALLELFCSVDEDINTTEWMRFLIMKWTNDIHQQITNYQPKYYGTNYQPNHTGGN